MNTKARKAKFKPEFFAEYLEAWPEVFCEGDEKREFDITHKRGGYYIVVDPEDQDSHNYAQVSYFHMIVTEEGRELPPLIVQD